MFRSGSSGHLTQTDATFLAAKYMRDELGLEDAKVADKSGDGGFDIASASALAQVKHGRSPVGRLQSQLLFGARGNSWHQILIFFSSSGYSQSAIAYADENDIALYGFDTYFNVWPVNRAARGRVVSSPILGDNRYIRAPRAVSGWTTREQVNLDDELQASARYGREALALEAAEAARQKESESRKVSLKKVEPPRVDLTKRPDPDRIDVPKRPYVLPAVEPSAPKEVRSRSIWRLVVACFLVVFSIPPILGWGDWDESGWVVRGAFIAGYYLVAALLIKWHRSR